MTPSTCLCPRAFERAGRPREPQRPASARTAGLAWTTSRWVAGLAMAWMTSAFAQAAPVVLTMKSTGTAFQDEWRTTLDEVARLSGSGWPAEGVVIELPAGPIQLEATLKLGPRQSGREGAPLVIRGSRQGKTVLKGSVPLGVGTALSPGDTPFGSIVDARVRRYELPDTLAEGLTRIVRQGQGREVAPAPPEPLSGGRAMNLAAWPASGFVRIATVPAADRLTLDAGAAPPRELAAGAEVLMHGYWGEDWADEWIPALPAEPGQRGLKLAGAAPLKPMKVGARLRIVNLPSQLDQPGEWVVSADKRSLLAIPWTPGGDSTLELTRLDNALLLEGVSHVRLTGFSIQGVRGDALVVNGGRDVRMSRLDVRVAGMRGIRAAGVAHMVEDCDVSDTGQGGVSLWGGDRRSLTPALLQARGNRFANFNRWVRTYRPAVQVGGVGNVAEGNLIVGGPHTGVLHYGNDHLIQYNHLAHLATETGDVGAIYTGMDWTARGTTIRYNVLQDIRGPGLHGSRGIYLDDQASGITVLGNVFLRVDQAVFIGGGRDNLIDGNLFIASSPAIHLDDRGLTWQKAQTDNPDGPLRKRLRDVPYRGDVYARYPGLATLAETEPGRPLGNVARRNAVADGQALHFEGRAERDLEVDRVFSAPQLRFSAGPAPRDRDFRQLELSDDSPALREGFPQLPWARMRCTRARWDGVPFGAAPRDDLADCKSPTR